MLKNKVLLLFITGVAAAALAAGCSTVFTASISGSMIDKASWEDDEQEVGIGDVEIFLYNDERAWNEDYTRWIGEGIRPDTVEEGQDPKYFISTISGGDGGFTFAGLIWNRLLPVYGKSGDRVEVFFLFYNRDYGIEKNTTPVFIVSDVTNQLTPFKLERITWPATVEGSVVNTSTGEGVGAVNVRMYVADSLNPPVYPEEPDYQTTTADDGSYTQNISFPKELGEEVTVKITVERNNFNCDAYDGDGTLNEAAADDFLETGLITKETTYTAENIEIKQTQFTENLEGRYSKGGTYTNGKTIWIFYNSDGTSTAPSAMTTGTDVQPQDNTYTYAEVLNDTTTEDGHFTFTGIQWTDQDYSTEKSSKVVYLYMPTSNEISAGALTEGTGYEQSYTLISATTNYVEVNEP